MNRTTRKTRKSPEKALEDFLEYVVLRFSVHPREEAHLRQMCDEILAGITRLRAPQAPFRPEEWVLTLFPPLKPYGGRKS